MYSIVFSRESAVQPLTSIAAAVSSSDGRVVRASSLRAVDLILTPSRVKPMTLKFVFTDSLLDVQH